MQSLGESTLAVRDNKAGRHDRGNSEDGYEGSSLAAVRRAVLALQDWPMQCPECVVLSGSGKRSVTCLRCEERAFQESRSRESQTD